MAMLPEAVEVSSYMAEFPRKEATFGMSRWNHYFSAYAERLLPYIRNATVENPLHLLEIGVCQGGSLEMWQTVFKDVPCILWGIDIEPKCSQLQLKLNSTNPTRIDQGVRNRGAGNYVKSGTVNVEILDQSDVHRLSELMESAILPKMDVIIDDGSHMVHHQRATFDVLYRHLLVEGGMYAVEDVHTSYIPSFGGGLKNENSFIEYSKTLLDQLNGWFCDRVTDFTIATQDISFVDSMVIFRKKTAYQLKLGPPSCPPSLKLPDEIVSLSIPALGFDKNGDAIRPSLMPAVDTTSYKHWLSRQ